jgi:acyl carrier protein
MNTEEFISRLAGALEVPVDGFDESFSLQGDNWDSLSHLSTIALIDEMYGIAVPTADLMDCKNVGEVVELVRQRL